MKNSKKIFLIAVFVTAGMALQSAYAFEIPKSIKDMMGSKSDDQSNEAATENQATGQEQPVDEGQPQEKQKAAPKPAAEKKPEIAVYPGAKQDSSVTKMMKDAMKLELACYRTNDSIPKVVEFYKKQKGLDFTGAEKEAAGFKRCKKEYNEYLKKELAKDCDRDVTIQNPWQDMKTGKLIHDTLICIVNTSPKQ